MLLSGDEGLKERLSSQLDQELILRIKQIRDEVQSHYSDPLGYVISKRRADAVEVILRQILSTKKSAGVSLADILGRWTMHPIAGIPFLLLVLYIIYKFVGEFGAGTSVDFVESVVFGRYINPWATEVINLVPLPLLQEFLVGDYGLITMGLTYAIAIILPIVSYFFIAFSVVEDTGYLPRLAIMVNRIFKAIGLNGMAERLFQDVLDLEDQETHESACRFEHIISEEAADNVCAVLGHPSHCPHGKPIPLGNCCEKGAKPVRPLVTTLNRMGIGEIAEVAYISAKEGSGFGRRRFGYRGGRGSGLSGREETRLSHLASLGIVPGTKIQLLQRRPSYVVKIDETYLGIDDAIAKAIYVKRLDRSRSRVGGAPQGESYP